MNQPFDFVLLRAPIQPLDLAFSFSEKPGTLFEEALYLSSPEYYRELLKANTDGARDTDKIERTFLKYWVRSCSRCTPFATFAGTKLAGLTEQPTSLLLNESKDHIRCLRLDMNYLGSMVLNLLTSPGIREHLKYTSNNSIYKVAGQYRYIEYKFREGIRIYELSSVAETSYLEALLDRAKHGAGYNELVGFLAEKAAVSRETASQFIQELITCQLLISDLEPAITGNDPLDTLIHQLKDIPGTQELTGRLKQIRESLSHPAEGAAYYQGMEKQLESINLNPDTERFTIQADLFLSFKDCSIEKAIIDEIARQTTQLLPLCYKYEKKELIEFKNRFYEKYQDQEIPLPTAMDPDLGIGYGSVMYEQPATDGFAEDIRIPADPETRLSFTDPLLQLKLSKYLESQDKQHPFITIMDDDLGRIGRKGQEIAQPSSTYLLGNLFKSNGRLDRDNFVFDLQLFGGPSAGTLFGRFTYGDKEIAQSTQKILEQEEAGTPDAIFAEIVHLPQARVGNILLRSTLRNYEIPYVGRSGLPADQQLPVDDIMVSIRNNEVVLRSRRHNKRVIPRLTTAHDFNQKSLPLYQFLCDLQAQGYYSPIRWGWEQLSFLKHLPRVMYKNIILQKACWSITPKDLTGLPETPAEQVEFFAVFRAKYKIPPRVTLIESDNPLLIDLGIPQSIQLFLHQLKKSGSLLIEEFLFTPDNCIISDKDGHHYVNEIIIPLGNGKQAAAEMPPLPSAAHRPAKRIYLPTSEWLYFKVYSGPKTIENLLKTRIGDFFTRGIEAGLFEKFFFVRYKDPQHHLRIRFFNTDGQKQLFVQKEFLRLCEEMLSEQLIDRVVIDSYNREIERYGSDLIALTEDLFFYDSLTTTNILTNLDDEMAKNYKFFTAMRSVDKLLSDFGRSPYEKKLLTGMLQSSFFKEFGMQPELRKQLNEKYRVHQQKIFAYLNDGYQDEIMEFFYSLVDNRSAMSKQTVSEIRAVIGAGAGSDGRLRELLPSVIHMSINRLFEAQQRKQELVLYHFLDKFYSSQLAIAKKQTTDELPVL